MSPLKSLDITPPPPIYKAYEVLIYFLWEAGSWESLCIGWYWDRLQGCEPKIKNGFKGKNQVLEVILKTWETKIITFKQELYASCGYPNNEK